MPPTKTQPALAPGTEPNPGQSREPNPGGSREFVQTCSFPPGVGVEGGGTLTKARSFFK